MRNHFTRMTYDPFFEIFTMAHYHPIHAYWKHLHPLHTHTRTSSAYCITTTGQEDEEAFLLGIVGKIIETIIRTVCDSWKGNQTKSHFYWQSFGNLYLSLSLSLFLSLSLSLSLSLLPRPIIGGMPGGIPGGIIPGGMPGGGRINCIPGGGIPGGGIPGGAPGIPGGGRMPGGRPTGTINKD